MPCIAACLAAMHLSAGYQGARRRQSRWSSVSRMRTRQSRRSLQRGRLCRTWSAQMRRHGRRRRRTRAAFMIVLLSLNLGCFHIRKRSRHHHPVSRRLRRMPSPDTKNTAVANDSQALCSHRLDMKPRYLTIRTKAAKRSPLLTAGIRCPTSLDAVGADDKLSPWRWHSPKPLKIDEPMMPTTRQTRAPLLSACVEV